ncbi:hypothetical protein EPO15_18110 [bacterium]|nr:MAG: hypothetical protein EPO15_18110 [bacterium]
MRGAALAVLLCAPAAAVELPDSWRCKDSEVGRYWKGVKQVSAAYGPNWGEKLVEEVPTPFVWLAIYKDRDRDVAERRGPINTRWADFTGPEKCAYLRHYLPEADAKKKEFDSLAEWRKDEGLLRRYQKLKGDEVIDIQDKEPQKSTRARYEAMHAWLTDYGLRDDDATLERAAGVFIRLSRLEAAQLDYLRESGWFRAQVRTRFKAAAVADPLAREAAIEDLSNQLSRDWRNESILGADFDRRLAQALRDYEREKAVEAASAKAGEVRRSAEEQKAAFKRAEAQVDSVEAELKKGKLVFQPSADPALLLSLEEYRQGKRKLADGIAAQAQPDHGKLQAAFLEMLADVCVTHYTGIRYKPSVIKTLCGR